METGRSQLEQTLHSAIFITEMGMEMKEKGAQGEKYANNLRAISLRTTKIARNLQSSAAGMLGLAQKMIVGAMSQVDANPDLEQRFGDLKLECDRLLAVIDRELPEPEESADCSVESGGASGGGCQKNLSDRIGCLEAKQKLSEAAPCVQSSVSVRSVKSDVDEKYPENWSRDSLIDLNTVVNLPPVPEDIFTCFSNKPTRTSSLSSLKGMRKVKLFLQRAANNSDDEDSSDFDEHDPVGDGEDKCTNSTKKLLLGNIKEETQQD